MAFFSVVEKILLQLRSGVIQLNEKGQCMHYATCLVGGILPDGLQHNILSLNLSHNRLLHLDGRLTSYTHLRVLDLSHNRLSRLPKRAIFINNTLANLRTLNLSHNHFWTLPTNLPAHLETVDLSHNLLVKVLPGSLERLPRLSHFYLHANRFSSLPFGALDKMVSLRVVTLGNNPWACHLYADVDYLQSWTQSTSALVLGCPCHTQPACGGTQPSRTGARHFGSFVLPPLAVGTPGPSSTSPEDSVTVTGSNRDSVEQRANKRTIYLMNNECLAPLAYFDHISDLSVLHDSVALVKIICMATERLRNANFLVFLLQSIEAQAFFFFPVEC
uniref:Oligodendrocyte myelin glycoprotein a n=1 Tax=Fundulus heteroclitus TaxID=8078 RepID=A0A3Q2PSJ6_FUNHE